MLARSRILALCFFFVNASQWQVTYALWCLDTDGSRCIWRIPYHCRQYVFDTLWVALPQEVWACCQFLDWLKPDFPTEVVSWPCQRKARESDLCLRCCLFIKENWNWTPNQSHLVCKSVSLTFLCFVVRTFNTNFIPIYYYSTRALIIKCQKIHYI